MTVILRGSLLTSGCPILCHQVNCRGVMDKGLARLIRLKYPKAFYEYEKLCEQYKDNPADLLGTAQIVQIKPNTAIANLFAQDWYGHGGRFTDYRALENCMIALKYQIPENINIIGFPYGMGSGLAGGNWKVIKRLIDKHFDNTRYSCRIYRS